MQMIGNLLPSPFWVMIQMICNLQLPSAGTDTDSDNPPQPRARTQAVQSYYRAAALQNAQKKNGSVGRWVAEGGQHSGSSGVAHVYVVVVEIIIGSRDSNWNGPIHRSQTPMIFQVLRDAERPHAANARGHSRPG